MRKVKLQYILISILVGFSITNPAYANPRDKIVNKELDYIEKYLHREKDLIWSNISYTHKETEQDTTSRLAEVEKTLDAVVEQMTKPTKFISERQLPTDASDRVNDKDASEFLKLTYEEGMLKETALPSDDYIDEDYYYESTSSSLSLLGKFKANLNLSAGYRNDSLDWNIADSDGSPNVLSELEWEDLEAFQVKVKGNIIFDNHYVFDGSIASAGIFKGSSYNSGYSADNRTSQTKYETSSSDNGKLLDMSGGLGYRLHIGEEHKFLDIDHIWLTLLGGYSYHEQNLIMEDGFSVTPATGAFAGLHNKYDTEWKGPWLGFELSGLKNKLKGLVRFEYHFVDYKATADWNLRGDYQHPASFEHKADGYGIVFTAGCGYQIDDNWSLDFTADIQDWCAEDGTDTLYLSTGAVTESKLNEVNWDSYALMLGATYRFPK